MPNGIAGLNLDHGVWIGEAGCCVMIARGRAPYTGYSRAAKRNRSENPGGNGRVEGLEGSEGSGCLTKRLERQEDIRTVDDTPTFAATTGDIDIVDSNSVDRDSIYYGIGGDTLMTDERSVGMGMDIVDSTCMATDGNAPANEDISRNINVVDNCMHVCVGKIFDVNVYVGSRTTRVAVKALTSA